MALEAGVVDARHLRARAQEARDLLGVRLVLAHAQRERLRAWQRQPGVPGAGDAAGRVAREAQALEELRIVDDDGAADHVRVAADVLRRRVYDDLRAVPERVLEPGGREGVVDDEERAT